MHTKTRIFKICVNCRPIGCLDPGAGIGIGRTLRFGQAFLAGARSPGAAVGAALLLLALGAGCATPTPEGWGAGRTHALGPFFEHSVSADGTKTHTAVRPLWSRVADEDAGRSQSEYLWPVASERRSPLQHNWRVLVGFGTDYDVADPESKSRFWLFPLWFSGRNAQGESYRALFPIGGRIDDLLGTDRMDFVLFPLHLTHTVGDTHTVCWLWPILSWSKGERRDIERFGVFPLYGYSRHGEEAWRRYYVLWPFWSAAHHYPEGSDPGHAWLLFPVGGRIDTERQQGWYILPPFFSGLRRDDGFRRWHLPWPFVQIQDGAVRKRMLWPLFGRRTAATREADFVLWPLWRTERVDYAGKILQRRRLLPFWESSTLTDVTRETDKTLERYVQLWPLYYRLQKGDVAVFSALDFWPGRNREAVERNWAPFWTLYRRRVQDEYQAVDALWGLYRFRRAKDNSSAGRIWPLWSWNRGETSRGWRLLGGLLGRQRDAEGGDVLRVAYGLRLRLREPRREGSSPDQSKEDGFDS